MKNKFLLLSAAILFAFTPMLAGSSTVNVKEKSAIQSIAVKSIGLPEVQEYMAQFQILIINTSTITGSENLYARDDHGQNYIVYVEAGIIKGWDTVDF